MFPSSKRYDDDGDDNDGDGDDDNDDGDDYDGDDDDDNDDGDDDDDNDDAVSLNRLQEGMLQNLFAICIYDMTIHKNMDDIS
jgi:hypothetical protein